MFAVLFLFLFIDAIKHKQPRAGAPRRDDVNRIVGSINGVLRRGESLSYRPAIPRG